MRLEHPAILQNAIPALDGTALAAPPSQMDFSLVLGGPLYQLMRHAHIANDAFGLVRTRLVAVVTIAWVPLLVLSVLGGQARGGAAVVPFLKDVEAQVRFLVALPLLVVAELVVHQRMRWSFDNFSIASRWSAAPTSSREPISPTGSTW